MSNEYLILWIICMYMVLVGYYAGKMLNSWQRHMFSGDTFGTPKQPKPKRP